MPKISIIIPVFNVERYLSKCLDSIINQTLKDIEIICVNDASTDNSLAILKEYAKKDYRIRVINSKKNRNCGGARNLGLKRVKSPYIMFVDSDDNISPNHCEYLYNNMVNNDVDLVLSYPNNYSLESQANIDKRIKELNNMDNSLMLPEGIHEYDFLHDKLFRSAPWAKLYKTEFFKKYHITFPENLIQEDEALYWYYMIHIKRLYSNTSRTYNRLVHENSIMYKKIYYNTKFLDHIKIFVLIYKYLKKYKLYEKYKEKFEAQFTKICICIENNKNLTPKDLCKYQKCKEEVEYKINLRKRQNYLLKYLQVNKTKILKNLFIRK